MDWGVITALVAVIFAVLGIGIGFFMSKVLSEKREEVQVSALEDRLEGITSKISETVERVNQKLTDLEEEKLFQLKEELSFLEEEVKRLKKEIASLPLSTGSLEAVERAEKLLKEIEFSLPEVDNSLLTQVKDSLIIVRNDVQNLIQMEKEKQKKETSVQVPELEDLLSSINSALKLSKEINTSLVKSELLTLASSIKGDIGEEVVKELDKQALNSKELILLLESIKKELEGVKR
ncbi:MAG: hypothetical protein ABGX17_03330 [Desulfurobacteriaceae bacterium]